MIFKNVTVPSTKCYEMATDVQSHQKPWIMEQKIQAWWTFFSFCIYETIHSSTSPCIKISHVINIVIYTFLLL